MSEKLSAAQLDITHLTLDIQSQGVFNLIKTIQREKEREKEKRKYYLVRRKQLRSNISSFKLMYDWTNQSKVKSA